MAKRKTVDQVDSKFITAKEIVERVKNKEDSQAFQDLRTQFEEDFDLLTLKPFTPKIKGKAAITSPAPRNDLNKVKWATDNAHLQINIVTPEDAPQNVRKAADQAEELLLGAINMADEQARQAGEPGLKKAVAAFGAQRGMVCKILLVYPKNEEKDTDVIWRTEDPLLCTWEFARDGLLWFAVKYGMSKGEVKQRFDKEVTGTDDSNGCAAWFIDYYDRKVNATVLIDGALDGGTNEFVMKPEEHDLDRVPAYVGFTSAMPTFHTKANTATLKYKAQSAYDSARTLYPHLNKLESYMMDNVEKAAVGTLVHMKDGGGDLKTANPYENLSVLNLDVMKHETLAPLSVPQSASELPVLLGLLDRDKQMSTAPFPGGYGADTGAIAGVTLQMRNENMRSVFSPYTELVAESFRWGCTEFLKQFKQKGRSLKVKGYDNNSKFYVKNIEPKEIGDDWYVGVTCEQKLPRDIAGELQMAIQATAPRPDGTRFLSDQTAYDEILKLQSPTGEVTRLENEQVKRQIDQLPSVQLRKAANAIYARGDAMGALELMLNAPDVVGQFLKAPQQPQQPQVPGANPLEDIMVLMRALIALPPEQRQAIVQRIQSGGQPAGGAPPVTEVPMQEQGGMMPPQGV